MIAGAPECVHDLEPLRELQLLLLRSLLLHLYAQLPGQLVDVNAVEQFLYGFRSHLRGELGGVLLRKLAVSLFVYQLFVLYLGHFSGVDNDVGLEVEHLLQLAQRQVEKMTDAGREPLEEPDVRARASQLYVPEPFAANLGLSNLDAALITHDAAVLHSFVLSAKAFPIGDGPEDFRAEQPIALRLERAIVYGLGLGDLAVRPRKNLLRRRQRNSNCLEIR